MRTVKFYTLGCKVNQYETQKIREDFLRAGLKEVSDSQPADFYLVNTCTVTAAADCQSLDLIRRCRRENSGAKTVVTGCLAELDAEKIKEEDRKSLIVKNRDKDRITRMLKFPVGKFACGISGFAGHTRAFLKVQDGCNNFCSYCKVPLVRGPSRSRPADEIIEEARNLARNNFKEIVLTGICLGAYGRDLTPQVSLTRLLAQLEKINAPLRFRLSSIEIGDVTDSLIALMAGSAKICRHLHIPLQSGDDAVLKRMRRRYCVADYLSLAAKIKKAIPGIAITTDVLVGFPAENAQAFQNSVKAVKKILPLRTHVFTYSPREHTAASREFPKGLGREESKRRADYLKVIAGQCSIKFRQGLLGQVFPVLLEGRWQKNPAFWRGYTDNYVLAAVKSPRLLKNRLLPLELKQIYGDCVLAR